MNDENTTPAVTGRNAALLLSVRVIPFAIGHHRLDVGLAVEDGTPPALPGSSPREGETLGNAARRIAAAAIGAPPDYLEQLYTFSVAGSPEEIIVAYFGVLSAETRASASATHRLSFVDVERLPDLSPMDRHISGYAVTRLRAKLGYSNVAFHFLPPEFTLSDLQDVYESVLGQPLDKRNFRRRVLAAEIVESVGAKRPTNHRPASLYRFTGGDPASGALTPDEPDRSN